jgi:hypothetical protein
MLRGGSANGAEFGDRENSMNIEEAIVAIDQMPIDSVLVAKPPLTWGAPAMFIKLTDDHSVPEAIKKDGYEYLLGREDIESLLHFLNKKKVSSRTRAEFIIHYAMTDSPPFWINDVPDL